MAPGRVSQEERFTGESQSLIQKLGSDSFSSYYALKGNARTWQPCLLEVSISYQAIIEVVKSLESVLLFELGS